MIYAEVIGDPIAQSKSPLIHKFWLGKVGLAGDYRAHRVAAADLPAYVAARREDADWRGCNVTIPHKLAVLDLVDDPGGVRSSIGAMNTILHGAGGTLTGTNTDAAGFFAPLSGFDLSGRTAVVIGSGGAARAVLFALSKSDVARVVVLARNPLKGAALLAQFGLRGEAHPLARRLPDAALLVNATSLGMTGQPPLTIDLAPLPDDALVYDIVYAPRITPLLAAAEARGLETVDGLEMLVGQAALAFELFFGAPAPREYDAELRALLTA
jgi:shikimate dehydrogenase